MNCEIKDNKIFCLCSCSSEVLVIQYDNQMELAELSIFKYYSNPPMSLYNKIRYIWRVLWHGDPYKDQIMLGQDQLKCITKFLQSIIN